MFSMFDILVVVVAVIVAGILWKTIKMVAKIVIILAIAWVLLKFVGFTSSTESSEVTFNQITYTQNV